MYIHTRIHMYRYLVSALPYFTWLMVIVTTAALIVQMHEVFTRDDKPFTYIWMMDLFFILFTVVELILKVLVPAAHVATCNVIMLYVVPHVVLWHVVSCMLPHVVLHVACAY